MKTERFKTNNGWLGLRLGVPQSYSPNAGARRALAPATRKGWALIEMLVAVMLMSAFGLIASKLFYSVSHISLEAKSRPVVDRAAQQALAEFRADVWNGLELKLENEKTLRVTQAGGQSVRWVIGDETLTRHVTVRDQPQEPKVYAIKMAPARVELLPGGVLVRMPDGTAPSEIQAFSQLLLVKGGGR